MPNRPYIFLEYTEGICSKCFRKAEAKIIEENDKIYLRKRCRKHGIEKVLIASDAAYWKQARGWVKPSEMPHEWNTAIKYGCPYDCGLCPDHEQHSCLTLVELTEACNLRCPVCYANSGPDKKTYHSKETIFRMLDRIVKNEHEPDVVQISGGEPTIHPDFFEILDYAKSLPIRHLMVNTNGLRIANDQAFVDRLKTYMPGFELYLQWDSLNVDILTELRGQDLSSIRLKALERLNEARISTTLVVTLQKGLNDHEIGEILEWAVKQPCVRGVTFQPMQVAGRVPDYDPSTDRLTLTDVRTAILQQTNMFKPEDLIPVPCHSDCLMMGYSLKVDGKIIPLTGLVPKEVLLSGGENTIVFEADQEIRSNVHKLFSLNQSPLKTAANLKDLLCCLPKIATGKLTYENVFRVLVMKFLDAYDLDMHSVKKSCVHIAHPDGERIIPFDTYNLFYRPEHEALLQEIRREMSDEVEV